MADIMTTEPQGFAAGELVQWTRNLGDYPAPTWVLTYAFINAGHKFSVTATADGANHLATITAAASAVPAGVYSWQAKVTSGTNVYLVGTGAIEIAPNFADSDLATYDNRTNAATVLAAIEAVIETRATEDQMAVAIAGRSITKMSLGELIEARNFYRREVETETMAANQAAGRSTGRKILVRFKN